MATWQERMAELVSDQRMRPLMEGLAEGACVDEGENFGRNGRIECDMEARLWLMARPDDSVPEPWRSLGVQLAKQKSAVDRFKAAAMFFNPENVPPGFDYEPDGDARDLSGSDFYTEVVQGADRLVHQGWSRHRLPELEYMRRKAEGESGWRRVNKSDGGERSSQEAEFDRLYNRFDRRFRYQAKKRRAQGRKQRETTTGAPM